MRDTKATIIDYYQGAYGPTIRIDVQDLEWLKLFKNNLIQLKNRYISELNVHSLKNVVKDEISGLKIVSGLNTDLSITANMQSDIYPSFIWTVNAEYINYVIGAIDHFLEHNKPGHYYLFEADIDIELAYKE